MEVQLRRNGVELDKQQSISLLSRINSSIKSCSYLNKGNDSKSKVCGLQLRNFFGLNALTLQDFAFFSISDTISPATLVVCEPLNHNTNFKLDRTGMIPYRLTNNHRCHPLQECLRSQNKKLLHKQSMLVSKKYTHSSLFTAGAL